MRGRDADAHANLLQSCGLALFVEGADHFLDVVAGAHGLQLVLVGAERRAPQRHDRVADVLVQRAVMAEDDVAHALEVLVHHRDHLGRRDALRQAGEAADVGEQDRDALDRAALLDDEIAGHDAFHEVGREHARQRGAQRGLLHHAALQQHVVDGDRSLPRHGRQHRKILLDKQARGDERVDVQHADRAVAGQQRYGHAGADALQHHGLRMAEAGIEARIGTQHGLAVSQRLLQDRARHANVRGIAPLHAGPHEHRRLDQPVDDVAVALGVVDEEHDAAIHR